MPFFSVYIQYDPEMMGWEITEIVPSDVYAPVAGARRIAVDAVDELGAYATVTPHLNKSNERIKAMGGLKL